MRAKIGNIGLGLAMAAACILGASGAAEADCRSESVSASGEEKVAIDEATKSAVDALVEKIVKTYGKKWSTGSHRSGQFDCHKNLGGTGGHPTRWTCTATTAEICRAG